MAASIEGAGEAGFRAVAPDMRGFGRTSAPDDVAAYTIFHNVGDMVALVSALGETRALIVGHDWGAPVAWHAALLRPDIFPAVCAMSVPHRKRGRAAPLETLKQAGKGDYYWIYFQDRAAEDEFARDARYTIKRLFHIGFGDTPREDKMSLYVDRAKGPPRIAARCAAATVAERGRSRRVRDRIPAHRLSRRAQLVSQHRPQLGADRAVAGREDHAAGAVHRRIERRGDHRLDGPARAR